MATPQEKPTAHPSAVASCSATDCVYNESRECHAGEIDVRIDQGNAVCATYETEEEPRPRP